MRLIALMTLALTALVATQPAAAQEPEWRTAREYEILLRPWDYEPEVIRLRAGEPVRLRFINQGQATFSFDADNFFSSARIRTGDAQAVAGGHLRLAPGEQRVISLVPARGRYRARSDNLIHRVLGMSARIVVE
jgi:plastocyanin